MIKGPLGGTQVVGFLQQRKVKSPENKLRNALHSICEECEG